MRGLAIVLGCLGLLAVAPAAWGHATLVASVPIDRAVVAQPPKVVKLIFNEPVSPLVLRLVGPGGQPIDLSEVVSADQVMTIGLPGTLSRGTHLLSWRVISADSHPVGGALTFSVFEPSAEPPMGSPFGADSRLQAAIWLGKLVLAIGLMFGIGGVFYNAWIADAPLPEFQRGLLSALLQCGLVAAIVSAGLQGVDAMGLPLSELRRTHLWVTGFSTSYGATACVAAASFVLALSVLHGHSRGRLRASLSLAGVGAALAVSGHAASAGPELLTRPTVFLHGASVAFWLGALMPLAVALGAGDRLRRELARFSRVIPAAVAVLIVTGLGLAVIQLGSLDALWTASYGLILLGKLAAVALLLAIGGFNRYVLTPRIAGGDPEASAHLSRSIKTEIAIAVAILGLVALWRFTPPPRIVRALAESPVQAHIHAGRAMADLRFEPARAGTRTVTIAVWDGNFAPLTAKEVTLVLSKPDAGIEPSRVSAAYVAETSWRVEGLAVPLNGRWRVTVEVLIDDFEKVALQDDIDFSR